MTDEQRKAQAKADELKEVRSQRHDFIKEYYRMATMDLDRHLKSGWQTIVIVAGGAAVLTAANEGKIGLPVATTIALASAFWSALTVIDSNYWSVRAIAFLANVEAVYFSKEDRKYFNPYAGSHPPYKLLNSLAYMFLLSVLFALATFLNAAWELWGKNPPAQNILEASPAARLMWACPVLVFVAGVLWTCFVWKKRLKDYLDFCSGSPGPGMIDAGSALRLVTLQGVGDEPLKVDGGLQDALIKDLTRKLSWWERAWPWIFGAGTLLVLTLLALFTASMDAKVPSR